MPSEVKRHGSYRYTVSYESGKKVYRFFELVTKVYLHQDTINYPVLDWEEIAVPSHFCNSIVGIIDTQEIIGTALRTA